MVRWLPRYWCPSPAQTRAWVKNRCSGHFHTLTLWHVLPCLRAGQPEILSLSALETSSHSVDVTCPICSAAVSESNQAFPILREWDWFKIVCPQRNVIPEVPSSRIRHYPGTGGSPELQPFSRPTITSTSTIPVTQRNGKYSLRQQDTKHDFERRFLSV
jgi:hypothetical protein